MRLNLDEEQVMEILTKWVLEEHGQGVNYAQWQVDYEDGTFEGIIIDCSP